MKALGLQQREETECTETGELGRYRLKERTGKWWAIKSQSAILRRFETSIRVEWCKHSTLFEND